jgi:hypothetical protein
MKPADLKCGITTVRHPLVAHPFFLSVVDCHGLKGIAGYASSRPPLKGKHFLLTGPVATWLEELEEVK